MNAPYIDEVMEVWAAPRWSGSPTTFRLRVFRRPLDGRHVAVVTELAENDGLSITNAAEFVWRDVMAKLRTTDVVMVEHYGPMSYHGSATRSNLYDEVTIDGRGVQWRRLPVEVIHGAWGILEEALR